MKFEMVLLRLPRLNEILPRYLERGLHSFRPAGREMDRLFNSMLGCRHPQRGVTTDPAPFSGITIGPAPFSGTSIDPPPSWVWVPRFKRCSTLIAVPSLNTTRALSKNVPHPLLVSAYGLSAAPRL